MSKYRYPIDTDQFQKIREQGMIYVDIRPEHMGMNPQKGFKMKIPEKKVAKWKVAKGLV